MNIFIKHQTLLYSYMYNCKFAFIYCTRYFKYDMLTNRLLKPCSLLEKRGILCECRKNN